MTIASERKYSLYAALEFLQDLLDPKKTPKVPKAIRQRASRALRHYPHKFDIERLAEQAPNLLVDEFAYKPLTKKPERK